jgi:hypothetical protein
MLTKPGLNIQVASDGPNQQKTMRSVLVGGLVQMLPASLVLTFIFTPSVSAAIFRAWYCVPYEYSDTEDYSFLGQDLDVRCDGSEEHDNILGVALAFVFLYVPFAIYIRASISSANSNSHPLIVPYWWQVAYWSRTAVRLAAFYLPPRVLG